MPNKNYNSGRNFEYRVKKYLESKGYLVFRSAGSHSIADLIAFPKSSWQFSTLLIQCKHHGKISKVELKKGSNAEQKHDFIFVVAEMKKRKLVFSKIVYFNKTKMTLYETKMI